MGSGGSALSHDGTMFASVNTAQHCVYMCGLPVDDIGKLPVVVFGTAGTSGSADGQLSHPMFTCFVRRNGIDTLLIADARNSRVVEVSVTGVFMRSIAVKKGSGPWGVAHCAHSDVIAVSLFHAHAVVLLQYESGAVKVTIGSSTQGTADGQLWDPQGLRFSADGSYILLAEAGNHRVSTFNAASGAFIANVATKTSNGIEYPTDVLQCEDGTIVVAHGASSDSVVCVGADGTTLSTVACDRGVASGSRRGSYFIPYSLSYSSPLNCVVVKEFEGSGGVMLLR